MNTDGHHPTKASDGGYVVCVPRSTDALGHALRSVFENISLPNDMLMLLRKLERVTH